MINVSIGWFVVLVILGFIGAIIVLAWILGLIIAIKGLFTVKKEEIKCPDYVENQDGE